MKYDTIETIADGLARAKTAGVKRVSFYVSLDDAETVKGVLDNTGVRYFMLVKIGCVAVICLPEGLKEKM
jgi:hypothetical protein